MQKAIFLFFLVMLVTLKAHSGVNNNEIVNIDLKKINIELEKVLTSSVDGSFLLKEASVEYEREILVVL